MDYHVVHGICLLRLLQGKTLKHSNEFGCSQAWHTDKNFRMAKSARQKSCQYKAKRVNQPTSTNFPVAQISTITNLLQASTTKSSTNVSTVRFSSHSQYYLHPLIIALQNGSPLPASTSPKKSNGPLRSPQRKPRNPSPQPPNPPPSPKPPRTKNVAATLM